VSEVHCVVPCLKLKLFPSLTDQCDLLSAYLKCITSPTFRSAVPRVYFQEILSEHSIALRRVLASSNFCPPHFPVLCRVCISPNFYPAYSILFCLCLSQVISTLRFALCCAVCASHVTCPEISTVLCRVCTLRNNESLLPSLEISVKAYKLMKYARKRQEAQCNVPHNCS
jgi:hypothetical protein